MGTRLDACFLPSETNILPECRGERESGKQGPLGEAGRPRSPWHVGMKDMGSGSLWREAELGPSDGSRVAPI